MTPNDLPPWLVAALLNWIFPVWQVLSGMILGVALATWVYKSLGWLK